jgi:WD40 repeat protein
MNALPRQILCEIVDQYGHSLSDDPRRTEALLRDLCGEYKGEIFVLVSALREQVASDLLASQDSVPPEVLLAQLTKRLQDNLALTESAARWAVESWALALGVIEHPLPSPPPRGAGESARVVVPTPPSMLQVPPSQAAADEGLLHVLRAHAGWVHSVAFHPDGRILASGSQDGMVRLWDVAGGQEIQWPLKGTSPVYSVAFSFDGHTLAWGSEDGRVRLWYMTGGREVRWRLRCTSSVYSVSFSPSGDVLASASADAVVLWDVQNGREMRQLRGHTHVVQSTTFSPAGRILASAGGDKTVRLWNVAGGKAVQVRRLQGHTEPVWSTAFSPDGRILASGSYDKTVRLWDVESGRVVRLLEGHAGGVNSVAFSPDGRVLASASLDAIVLWDVTSGQEMGQLKGHTHLVQSVAFSPDGRVLASGSWDETVRLWRTGLKIRR